MKKLEIFLLVILIILVLGVIYSRFIADPNNAFYYKNIFGGGSPAVVNTPINTYNYTISVSPAYNSPSGIPAKGTVTIPIQTIENLLKSIKADVTKNYPNYIIDGTSLSVTDNNGNPVKYMTWATGNITSPIF